MKSNLIIEEMVNNEIKIDEKYISEINNFRSENQDFFKKYPSEQMKDAVTEKLMKKTHIINESQINKKITEKSFPTFKSLKIISLAAAAVLAICVIPVSVKNNASTNVESVVRVKGVKTDSPKMKLYKKSGEFVEIVKDGSQAYEDDQIQIVYSSAGMKYGLIFSVDGYGNVTNHFNTDDFSAIKLDTKNKEVPLEYSYVLDDAPKYECFVFVTSNKPFNLKNIDKHEKSMQNLNYVKKGKYLPKDCKKSILVLNK